MKNDFYGFGFFNTPKKEYNDWIEEYLEQDLLKPEEAGFLKGYFDESIK